MQELGPFVAICQRTSHQFDLFDQISSHTLVSLQFPVQLADHLIFDAYPVVGLFLESAVLFGKLFVLFLDGNLRPLALKLLYPHPQEFVHVLQTDQSFLLGQYGLYMPAVFRID